MSSVTITYHFDTLRTKVSPNASLNGVLLQSLQYFKLITEDHEAAKWCLLHANIPIALDIPFVFLNLPVGVKLKLDKKPNLSKVHGTDEPKLLKIKLQVPGSQPLVLSVNNKENLKKVINTLAQDQDWDLDPDTVSLQVFSKVLRYDELEAHSLESLGISTPTSLRLNIGGVKSLSKTEKPEVDVAKVIQTKEEETSMNAEMEDVSKHREVHKVSVYVPSNVSHISELANRDEEDELKVTIDHAKIYQHIVSRKAGTLGGPLLTKRLREQYERQGLPQKTKIVDCVIRVRFPDRTHIEVAFKPDDTMATVYSIVKGSLINEETEFILRLSHPYKLLENNDDKLTETLGFVAKTLLLFESDGKGPFIKKALVSNAKNIEEADDVKLDNNKSSTHVGNTVKTNQPNAKSSSGNSTSTGKVPKWLKLGKK
ncbi:hypothetical protein Kpol_1073p9 [Vanderwaltozyma polyspora DSM 70294]|uniref:UBX domain-containing protein n=1 Tax=Vanderwaltozyma polyspora (strain ATCC 22028 / DSM 70294 / BCRC 21397 / CBS 2163 / NBRC 10782 / NRRL Y-8283 / UCD 57-17) TaxID=436907 RepID=A7TPS2_VANPO|nr:uncharacterized protein Kpol_1073p9 [Vanderwaltozyma polyspora DSM 70294]EDO15723.1 hypothetical protein Kpol_1073p9 [Vanderwaltozyma polyspora DSM 70294]